MRRIALGALLLVAGCLTPGVLESKSLKSEMRADQLAQFGEGNPAAQERDRSVAYHEEAKRRALTRNSYLTSEVFLW